MGAMLFGWCSLNTLDGLDWFFRESLPGLFGSHANAANYGKIVADNLTRIIGCLWMDVDEKDLGIWTATFIRTGKLSGYFKSGKETSSRRTRPNSMHFASKT